MTGGATREPVNHSDEGAERHSPDKPRIWNSLEVAKLLVAPIVVLAVGWWLNSNQSLNQRLVERRLALYDAIGPQMNDIYCYSRKVGHWKELTPDEIVRNRRSLDQTLKAYSPLLSPGVLTAYDAFMSQAFLGPDNRINATLEGREAIATARGHLWSREWNDWFTGRDRGMQVAAAYEEFLKAYRRDLGS